MPFDSVKHLRESFLQKIIMIQQKASPQMLDWVLIAPLYYCSLSECENVLTL